MSVCSMEECEALCTRLAIMVNGRLKCLGSIQHLKNKFGEGYTVLIKVQSECDTYDMTRYVENRFPTSVLKDAHQCMLHYHISDDSSDRLKLSELFGAIEEARVGYRIEDYSISQTTLEQVFVNFARSQEEPRVDERGRCFWCYTHCCRCCRNEYILLNGNHNTMEEGNDLDRDGDLNPLIQNV